MGPWQTHLHDLGKFTLPKLLVHSFEVLSSQLPLRSRTKAFFPATFHLELSFPSIFRCMTGSAFSVHLGFNCASRRPNFAALFVVRTKLHGMSWF